MFKNWFSKSQSYYGNFAFLKADMHSHLLFGIDDGAKTIEETLYFIEQLQKLGYSSFITTPHILSDLYPNSASTIKPIYKQVTENISVDMQYAAEYMIDSDFDAKVQTDQLLTFGDKYVLVEMSYLGESKNFREVIFQLKVKGYQPILAHPERYNYWHRDYSKFIQAKEIGCLFQLNLLSVTGYYGAEIKNSALKMLADNLYDFAGTDLHHEKHLEALNKLCSQKMLHALSMYNFRNSELASVKL
jgi:protein-tyrosine phosphatase